MASPKSRLGNDMTITSKRPLTPQAPLPSAPDPSTDPGIVPAINSPPFDDGLPQEETDLYVLTPVGAMKMLCRSIDAIVQLTGDVSPTPPLPSSNYLSREGVHLASKAESTAKENLTVITPEKREVLETAIGSPEAHSHEPVSAVAPRPEHSNIQHRVIVRKFYSKRPPLISTEEYLLRIHRYCPMSTAVYLATSFYISRLAVFEQVIPLTPRNVHRLLLAGLRVAMKALEDLNYPHSRFAKVGGVSEVELGRLEITFCFLMNFDLRVDAEMLRAEIAALHDRATRGEEGNYANLLLPNSEKDRASSSLPTRPFQAAVEAPS